MPDIDYDILSQTWDSGQSNKRIRFTTEAVKDEAASEVAGMPKYRDVDYVEIRIPGDKYNVVKRPLHAGDKQEFARQYEAWKAGQKAGESGMPLAELPGIAGSQVKELQYANVHTVEALAGLPDSAASAIGGNLFSLRDKAQKYLAHAKDGATAEKAQKELEAERKHRKELEDRLAKLEAAQSHAGDLRKGK